MKLKLISLWNWFEISAVVVVWTLLVALVFAVTVPFDRNRRIVGRLFRHGGLVMIGLNPLWRVRRSGYAVNVNTGPYVVVSNHQSIADIPAMSILPGEMKWLSKASVFKLPLFGWMMRMVGDIPLHRGDRDSASGAMVRARGYLDRGMSVMIFPEGTRSVDGKIASFKNGAFRLAIESGRPVLPVVIMGSRDAIPKTSWVFGGRCDVQVEVLPPVATKHLTLEDVDTLREHVHAEICAGFERLKRKEIV